MMDTMTMSDVDLIDIANEIARREIDAKIAEEIAAGRCKSEHDFWTADRYREWLEAHKKRSSARMMLLMDARIIEQGGGGFTDFSGPPPADDYFNKPLPPIPGFDPPPFQSVPPVGGVCFEPPKPAPITWGRVMISVVGLVGAVVQYAGGCVVRWCDRRVSAP